MAARGMTCPAASPASDLGLPLLAPSLCCRKKSNSGVLSLYRLTDTFLTPVLTCYTPRQFHLSAHNFHAAVVEFDVKLDNEMLVNLNSFTQVDICARAGISLVVETFLKFMSVYRSFHSKNERERRGEKVIEKKQM